jgi:hypothetical protein
MTEHESRLLDSIDSSLIEVVDLLGKIHNAVLAQNAGSDKVKRCKSVYCGERCQLPMGHSGYHYWEDGRDPALCFNWQDPTVTL